MNSLLLPRAEYSVRQTRGVAMLSKKAVVCLSEMHVMERRGQVGVGGEKSPMVHARIGEGRNTFRVSGKAAMRTTATGGGISWALRGRDVVCTETPTERGMWCIGNCQGNCSRMYGILIFPCSSMILPF